MSFYHGDIPSDVLAEHRADRQARARLRHWCRDCLGRRGGPCEFGDEEPELEDNEQEEQP